MKKEPMIVGKSAGAIEGRRRRKRLRAITGGKCFYCGCPTTQQGQTDDGRDWILAYRHRMVREHVIPTSRGGTNDRSNHTPSCAGCNWEKGPFTIDEFRFARGLQAGDLNFRFAFESPAKRRRDWLCCHSKPSEKALIEHNMPSAATAYLLRRRSPNGTLFEPRIIPA